MGVVHSFVAAGLGVEGRIDEGAACLREAETTMPPEGSCFPTVDA